MDVWALAEKAVSSSDSQAVENHVIFLGPVHSGKTTLLNNLVGKVDEIKPTTALDYSVGRRKNDLTDTLKAIGHAWELGGGLKLKDLIQFPLNPKTWTNSVSHFSLISNNKR